MMVGKQKILPSHGHLKNIYLYLIMREKMESWELEEKIEFLSGLNEDSCERPDVINQRKMYIDYLKRLLNNINEDNNEIRDK